MKTPLSHLQGKAIIFTAPSGSGKTSIIRPLLKRNPSLTFSTSATTRPARNGETDGQDYYFLTVAEFENKVAKDEFVEWELVYPGKMYGTLKSEVDRLWSEGKVIIFDVEVKGALNLKHYFGDAALALFIRVPSVEVLRERLVARNTESEESLKERLERAEFELSFEGEFDVVVINHELDRAISEADALVKSFIEANPSND